MSTMSYLKLRHFLFLLVLLVSCALCTSHNGTDDEIRAPRRPPPPRRPPTPPRRPPPPPSRPPPGYNYFLLALTWPNGFCSQQGKTCIPSPPEQQYFTVHGLWPQKNRGPTPIDCQAPPVTDAILKALETDLKKYWPSLSNAKDFQKSKGFWTHEWNKHGSCSSNKFPPKGYFERGIALGKDYGQKILTYLERGGIKPDGRTEYNTANVLNAIKKGTSKNAIISCTKTKSGKLQLAEVRLCFDANGKTLKDCTQGSPSCNANFIFASKQLPRVTFLEWISSIMEAEEVVRL